MVQAIDSVNQPFSVSPPAEALGVMLLLLSLELLATDGPLVDNEGAVRNIGEEGGDKKREL